jgi:hypothetical protein
VILAACALCAASKPVGVVTGGAGARAGGLAVVSQTPLFPGDAVDAGEGTATITLASGAQVFVRPSGSVRIDQEGAVEILRGMSRVRTDGGRVRLIASGWTMEARPSAGRLIADVVRDSDAVSVRVEEGMIEARSRTTHQVASALPGRALLLPAAAEPPRAGSSSPSSAQAPPPAGSGSGPGGWSTKKTIVVTALTVAAAAGVGAGVAVALREDSSKLKGDIAGLKTQLAAMSSQNAAQQSQISGLNGQMAAMQSALSQAAQYNIQAQVLLSNLSTAIASLQAAQVQSASIQTEINGMVAQVAAGTPLTPQQQTRMQQLQQQQLALNTTISNLSNSIQQTAAAISALPPPTPVSPTG